MQRIKTLAGALALAAVALWPSASQAGWDKQHMDPSNNAVLNQNALVQDVSAGPAWSTGPQKLMGGCGVAMYGGKLFTTAIEGHFTNGETQRGDDKFSIKAFNAATGKLAWESPQLDLGLSVDYWTISSPTVDPATGALYVGSGQSVQKLDGATGALLASVKLTAANTAAGLSYDIVNSSPALGGGLLFIETYGGGAPALKQLVALRPSDLSVAWAKNATGFGTGVPCYVDGRVYTTITGGIACYNAANGDLVWNSATLAQGAWSVSSAIYASLVYSQGNLYLVTAGAWGQAKSSELLCVNAASGALNWRKPAPTNMGVTPLVLNGKVYLQGGVDGDNHLIAYNVSDGAEAFDQPVGGSSYTNYLAATLDRLYLTDQACLKVIDPASGAVLKKSDGFFDGPVSLDTMGRLYANEGGALKQFSTTVPVELSGFSVE